MKTYVLLFRGINVGGKNKLPMAELRMFLEELGCQKVMTYIQSGNAIVRSSRTPGELQSAVEEGLPKKFKLDSSLIKVLVLTHEQLEAVIDGRPQGFGDQPDKYHSDAIFLMDINAGDAMAVFNPRDGVDLVWPGNGVIYSQRVSALRTKSRLNRIMGTPLYKSMTIRSWSTATKLLELLETAL